MPGYMAPVWTYLEKANEIIIVSIKKIEYLDGHDIDFYRQHYHKQEQMRTILKRAQE